jgi:D-sedoheptulose 7-phosphate isomerase
VTAPATTTPQQRHSSPAGADLASIVVRQAREACAVKDAFFPAHANRIVACAQDMAARFDAGGRLFAMGNGGSSCDAIHLSVEFMHPIIEKRPPLPTIALTTDLAILTAIGNDQDFSLIYSQQLRMLGRAGDMVLGVSTSGKSSNINRALQLAREMGMTTIGFTGKDGGRMPPLCDHCFVVPSFSIPRIQEAHETLLHVIWDLVHVIRGEEDVM